MRRRYSPLFFLVCASVTGAGAASSCSATGDPNEFPPVVTTSATGAGGVGGGGGKGGTGGAGGMGGEGGLFAVPDAGSDAEAGVLMNPCGTQCGPKELCDDDHLGLDDDCDTLVDEDCPCNSGEAHPCFKGDPSYHGAMGCFDGNMSCTENGFWGPCLGGVHAAEGCFANDTSLCHPLTATPFQDVNLKEGTGDFSLNAAPGSEAWTVTCPAGVDPCPGVLGQSPADDFKPLQSGEYTVTYTKEVPGGGTDACSYPLFVGAPGLRVELQWEHNLGGEGVDLDLHVHQPNTTQPWSVSGAPQDCTWSNCVVDDFANGSAKSPDWFMAGMPPDPVSWYLDPVFEKNTCYFAPRGVGEEWQKLGLGCHSPRLDLDNITCDPSIQDVNNTKFCAPENVNIDVPPKNEWTRIGVSYYSAHGKEYDVHPTVKIFCNGALAATLGPAGYYDPESPVTFAPYDGLGSSDENRFWLVADVAFKESKCGAVSCVVKPVYSDPASKTPFLTVGFGAAQSFGPPYPPPP
ncbi:MAG TPA: hypothetical protein VE093_49065, partial [Polyangiaceae bacterium]|nr:hypothetical protein [Polyangiaceae bacterium]